MEAEDLQKLGRMVLKARRYAKTMNSADRDRALRAMLDSEAYPALLSVILEFEEDLAAAVADYHRSPDERAMDAGGLASMRKLRGDLEALLVPVEKEPEAPK